MSFILVAIGGALGSVFRYSIGILFSSFSLTTFPWGTLFVNITGSFLMGIVFFISKDFLSEEFKLFLSVGLLGGYTTFSAFSLDVINMLFNRDYLLSILYILSSVFISILFLLAGFLFIKFLNS
ncbi:MAG: fluoride efflux transporter CrcB [Pseudomonadota bacterium]|nr:fluoride efflux transporter CrcB [Pseudomonadota bacterium]